MTIFCRSRPRRLKAITAGAIAGKGKYVAAFKGKAIINNSCRR